MTVVNRKVWDGILPCLLCVWSCSVAFCLLVCVGFSCFFRVCGLSVVVMVQFRHAVTWSNFVMQSRSHKSSKPWDARRGSKATSALLLPLAVRPPWRLQVPTGAILRLHRARILPRPISMPMEHMAHMALPAGRLRSLRHRQPTQQQQRRANGPVPTPATPTNRPMPNGIWSRSIVRIRITAPSNPSLGIQRPIECPTRRTFVFPPRRATARPRSPTCSAPASAARP